MKRNLYAILLCVLVLTMFASTAFASDEQRLSNESWKHNTGIS